MKNIKIEIALIIVTGIILWMMIKMQYSPYKEKLVNFVKKPEVLTITNDPHKPLMGLDAYHHIVPLTNITVIEWYSNSEGKIETRWNWDPEKLKYFRITN